MSIFRRIAMGLIVWALLSGSVFYCSGTTGDGAFLPGDNRPPVAADDSYQVPAGTSLSGAVRATDPDGDPLVFTLVSGPTLGRLARFEGATGAFLYVSTDAGTDTFTFRASDGRAVSGTGRVDLTVTESPGTVIALAATVHGPVVLAEGRLARLDPIGPVTLAHAILRLSPEGELRRADGGLACLERWSGGLRGGACVGGAELLAPPGRLLAMAADPFAAGRGLAIEQAGEGHRLLATQSGGREWAELTGAGGKAESAALHFDLLRPGTVWLALSDGRATRVLAGGQGGRQWRTAAVVPGRVENLAGLAARRGVYALREPGQGPVMVVVEEGR